jgi:hypothetical protein
VADSSQKTAVFGNEHNGMSPIDAMIVIETHAAPVAGRRYVGHQT